MWKYDKLSQLQLDLLGRRIVDLTGEVDMNMVKYTREAILRLEAEGSPDIEVKISSPGGDVTHGLNVFDLLRLYPGKKKGMVYGFAASMGAVILQACTERCAAANAKILIHHVSQSNITLDTLRDKKKLANLKEEMETVQQHQYKILSARTKRTVKQIRFACAKDQEMSAEEALAFGLIDTIV